MNENIFWRKVCESDEFPFYLVGLTGSIASGKSTVLNYWKKMGAEIIEADRIAHEAMEENLEVLNRIISEFGSYVLLKNGKLDRTEIGNIVFGDKEKLEWLNSLLHPIIAEKMKIELDKFAKKGYSDLVVLEIPLLFEKMGKEYFHKVVLVACNNDLLIQRLMDLRGLSKEEARERIDSQISTENKRAMADIVIENSGSLQELWLNARETMEALKIEVKKYKAKKV